MPLIKYIIDSISGRNPAIKESNSDLEEDFIQINLQNREFFLVIIVLVRLLLAKSRYP